MSCGTSILHLPDELLWLIAKNFKGQVLIRFALTCRRFSSVCARARKLNFNDAFNVIPADLAYFCETAVNYSTITECCFDNCYWIPASILSGVIGNCVNVTVLRVANTQLSYQQLTQLFAKCTLITELSFTIGDPKSLVPEDFFYYLRHNLIFNGQTLREAFEQTRLSTCSKIFNQLVKLEVFMTPDIILLATLLSACGSLQNLSLILLDHPKNFKPSEPSFDWNVVIPESALTLAELQSVVLFFAMEPIELYRSICFGRYEENYSFGFNMIKSHAELIERHAILRTRSRLKCVWSNMDALYDKSLYSSMKLFSCPQSFHDAYCGLLKNESIDIESIKLGPYMNNDSTDYSSHRVKFVDCYYKREKLTQFCKGHPELRKLRLRDMSGRPQDALHSEFTSLSNLRYLTSLSIDVGILLEAGRGRRREPYQDPQPTLLPELVKCGLGLEEFEIFGNSMLNENYDSFPSSDLSLIANWKSLKKLSLGTFSIDDGHFLVDILTECTMLESLRLMILQGYSYIQGFCTALPLARNLRRLRLDLAYGGRVGKILDAVSNCTSLVQLYVMVKWRSRFWHVDSDGDDEDFGRDSASGAVLFSYRMLQLVNGLPELVCLHCHLRVPESHCAAATKALVETVTPKRTSFRVQLLSQGCDNEHSTSLPFVHQRPLDHFEGDFSALPYEGY